MGGKSRPPYPAEFRGAAVRLVQTRGTSISQVARELGMHPKTLRLWVKQVDIDAGRRDGLTTEERAELTRLRRENRILKEEREILRKAAAFFAAVCQDEGDLPGWLAFSLPSALWLVSVSPPGRSPLDQAA